MGNGEVTCEPLSIMAKSDPILCVIYAKENRVLHLLAKATRHINIPSNSADDGELDPKNW